MKPKQKNQPAESPEELQRRRVLQEALACLLPEPEAETVCARLLEAFGSFDGIFCAPEEVLRDVPGVGEKVAHFLRLVIRLSQTYLEERSWNLRRIYDTPSAVEMFRPKFLGRKTEAVCLMLLDGRGRMVYNDIICEGSISEVPLYLRQVLQLCMEYKVEEVFLAHNHPSGMAFPLSERPAGHRPAACGAGQHKRRPLRPHYFRGRKLLLLSGQRRADPAGGYHAADTV